VKFSLDTNVLVYAIDRDAGPKHEHAGDIISRAAKANCVLTVQVLGEFYHVVRRKHGYSHDVAESYVQDWLSLFPAVGANPRSLEDSLVMLRSHSLSFWDALLWATVSSAGCRVLLSEDMQDGRVLGGVTILNPFAEANAPRVNALLIS
jgi:predicted nucleic acid-binding protein